MNEKLPRDPPAFQPAIPCARLSPFLRALFLAVSACTRSLTLSLALVTTYKYAYLLRVLAFSICVYVRNSFSEEEARMVYSMHSIIMFWTKNIILIFIYMIYMNSSYKLCEQL